MSIKIHIPSFLQSSTNGVVIAEVNGSTVGECLNHLFEQFPATKTWVLSEKGEWFVDVIIALNGKSAYPEQLAKPVKHGDEIQIILLVDGG